MSDLGNIYNSPLITSINGLVTDDSVIDVNAAAHAAFTAIEYAIGNIHGVSDINEEQSRLTNTIAGVLGSLQDEYVIPSGVEFNSYTQSFVLNTSKTFVLDLEPIPLSILTIDDGSLTVWTKVASPSLLTLDTDYCVVGRMLTFYAPPANFDVTYSGTFNKLGQVGYRPNVIPNQQLRAGDLSDDYKPVITDLGSDRYRVVIPEANSNGHIVLNDTIPYELSDYLQQYISPLGDTPCPQQYLSVWKKDNNKFYKLECSFIYIISETTYEFVTTDSVEVTDEIAIVVANRGLLEDVAASLKTLLNHSHLGTDGTSLISHSTLNDLIPVSDKPNVQYAGSKTNGNDHPQYIHREGYTENDPGTYNNAFIGDFLLASINPASLFNNVLSDSNILYFGSTANGHSFKRRAINKDLLLFSTENGLSVQYDDTVADNYGLNIVGNKIRNTVQGLSIESATGHTYFRTSLGVLKDIHAGVINGVSAEIETEVNIASEGELNIGNISFVHAGTNLTVDGTNNTDKIIFALDIEGSNATIETLETTNLNISTDDKINFLPAIVGSEDIYFTSILNMGAAFNSSKPLYFTGYGKNSGLAFSNKAVTEIYANIYVSSETGAQPTNSDHNTYFECGTADVYFLKDTLTSKIVDGITYEWAGTGLETSSYKPIDNLKNWPRANIFTSTINTNALRFGQYNAISTTGSNQSVDSNKTIIHADNGVLFSKSQSSDYYIASANKANIEVLGIDATSLNGTNANITTATITNLIGAVGGTVVINGDTILNGTTTFNNEISFNDDVNIGVLNVTNVGNFDAALNANNATIQNLVADVSTNLKGQIVFSEHVLNPSSFTCNVASTFNEAVDFSAVVTATQLVVNGSLISSGTFEASLLTVTNTLNVSGNAIIENLNVNNDFTIAGDLTCEGLHVTADTTIDGKLTTYGETTLGFGGHTTKVYDDIEMSSAGKIIDMNGGTIESLEMPTYIYDFLAEPSAAIDPVRGKDAVNREFVINAILNIASQKLLSIMYPLSSIYMSTNNPNSPGFTSGPFGALAFGDWEKIPGRCLFGDGGWTDAAGEFRNLSANSSGGEYQHVLTKEEMAKHFHKGQYITHDFKDGGPLTGQGLFTNYGDGTNDFTTEEVGGDDPHNNMPPYLVVYMWKRIG